MKLALFDLDHTLLPIDSDHAWGRYTVQRGWRAKGEFEKGNDYFYQQYQQGTLDIAQYIRFATEVIRELGEKAALEARDDFMRDVIEPAILPQALDLVEQYRDQGYERVLITATNAFITEPIARRFSIEHLIAVNLKRDQQGLITGEIEGAASFREGKILRLEQWLHQQNKAWSEVQDSVFYSDSINDLFLLDRVHRPIATNPDHRLRALAIDRQWPILELFS